MRGIVALSVGSALVLAVSLVTTPVAWANPPTTNLPVIPSDLVTYPAFRRPPGTST